MKIDPANHFIQQKVTLHGEVVMVLGVRKAESSTRAQLMRTYQVQDHILRRHTSLRAPTSTRRSPISRRRTSGLT